MTLLIYFISIISPFSLQGANYKLTNRVSARQEENELVIRLNNNASLNGDQNYQKKNFDINENGDRHNHEKPRIGTWSEFSTRHSDSPLPYW